MKDMKILVTGGSGFAGSNLIKYFHHHGFEVIATYRNNKPHEFISGVKYVRIDLSNRICLEDPVDAIVHTAVSQSGSVLTMEEYIRDNIDTARNIVDFARRTGVKTIIYFSTRSIYGEIRCEEVYEENDIINPDKYGQVKFIAEQIFKEAKGINTIGIRTPGIIGPGAHDIWLKKIVDEMINNEPIIISDFDTKNLVHIDDIGKFICILLDKSAEGKWFEYSVVNLACKDTINNKEIVEIIRKRTKSKSVVTVKEKGAGLFVLNADKAYKMGFVSKTPADIVNDYLTYVLDKSL